MTKATVPMRLAFAASMVFMVHSLAMAQVTSGGPSFEAALKSEGRLGTDFQETFTNAAAKRLNEKLKEKGQPEIAESCVVSTPLRQDACRAGTGVGNVTIGRFSPVLGSITVVVREGSRP